MRYNSMTAKYNRRKLVALFMIMVFVISAVGLSGKTVNAASGEWIQEKDQRWWYKFSDGSYAQSEYIDGYWLDEKGWYDGTWNASWQSNGAGWWYQSVAWYPVDCWLKIDSKWYHFNKSGYMDSGKWIGTSYVGKDGAWKTYFDADQCRQIPQYV